SLELLADRDLKVMPGDTLVIGEGPHAEARTLREVPQIGVEDAGARAVDGAGLVIRSGGRRLPKRRNALDSQTRLGAHVEHRTEAGIRLGENRSVFFEDPPASVIVV